MRARLIAFLVLPVLAGGCLATYQQPTEGPTATVIFENTGKGPLGVRVLDPSCKETAGLASIPGGQAYTTRVKANTEFAFRLTHAELASMFTCEHGNSFLPMANDIYRIRLGVARAGSQPLTCVVLFAKQEAGTGEFRSASPSGRCRR